MNKYINIIAYVSVILFVMGMVLIIIQGIDNEYVFDYAKIIDVQEDIIKVEAGEQNGDPIIYEIEKPFYKKCKSGDYISIKNKNGAMKYTVNRDSILNIAVVSFTVSVVCFYLYLAYNVIIAIKLYRHAKNKK